MANNYAADTVIVMIINRIIKLTSLVCPTMIDLNSFRTAFSG